MPFLNLSYQMLIYEDSTATKNPDIRLPDISKSVNDVPVDFDKSERLAIYSNEIKDIVTTQRPVAWDATTEIEFLRPVSGSDIFRLQHTGTGTNPSFRTNRNLGGDATTEVTFSRVTDYVARIQVTGGSVWNTGSVAVNDLIKFERDTDSLTGPLQDNIKGQEFLIQNVGVDFIDYVDNGVTAAEGPITLGADYAEIIKALSQSPVKAGDIIQISDSSINPSNHGKFEVLAVSDSYVEFANPLGVSETLLFVDGAAVIYEYLIGFVHLRASGPVKVRFGGQTNWVQLDRIGPEVLFIGSVNTHKIEALNDKPDPVTISIQHSTVSS